MACCICKTHKVVCCDGPISLLAASAFFSIYIMIINAIHISAAFIHVFGKPKSSSTVLFILVNIVVLVVCCLLSAAGILLFIGSLLRIKCILKWASPTLLILVIVRLCLTIIVFLEGRRMDRLIGDVISGVVQLYASYLFWNLYKETKLRRSTLSTARAAPKTSIQEGKKESNVC